MSLATLERKKSDELGSMTRANLSLANDESFATQLMAKPNTAASAAALVGTGMRLLVVALIICLTLQFMDRIARSSRHAGDDRQSFSQLGIVFPDVSGDAWAS